MAKKTLALFVICIVVLAAMVPFGEAADANEERYKSCYNTCYDECKSNGKGHTTCEMNCDEDCEAKDAQAILDEATG